MDNTKLITQEDIRIFLEGHDPEERIVQLEYSYQDDFITIYYRNENDDKCVRNEPFLPFLWARSCACEKMCFGNRKKLKELLSEYKIWVKKLSITNSEGKEIESMRDGYRYMFYATEPMSYRKFLEFFKRTGNPVYKNKKNEENEEESFATVSTSMKEDRQYLILTPKEQFLTSTGKRMFKGYDDYDQLLRLIFDLETEGLDPTKDRIKLNGIRFNRKVKYNNKEYDFERIFKVSGETEEEKDKSELELIDTMFRVIYTFKPDVITAHNGENFDWEFIIERCNQLGTSIEAMSAKYFDGNPIYKNQKETILKLGGEIETFKRTVVHGITITDSLHAVRRAQATDSNFKEANLKYSTTYLGLGKNNRVYVPGAYIDDTLVDTEEHYAFNNTNGDWYLYDKTADKEFSFDGTTKRNFIPKFNNIAEGYELVSGEYIVTRYLLDDLYECDKVEYALNGTDFMLSKIIPIPYQKVCTMGTASQWKAIMLAWSYEHGLAIPYAENTGSFTGGLSRLLSVGFVDNVIKLDYNSLYPSILLTWGIEEEKDLLHATLYLLEYVLSTREKHKKLKKNADKAVSTFEERINNNEKLSDDEVKEYQKEQSIFKVEDNRQAVFKKLGNSYFGSLSSNVGSVYPWKSVACGERTTCTGRQSLRLMISHFSNLGKEFDDESYNYKPIVGDSFTGDTPLFVKYKDSGLVDIVPIEEMIDNDVIDIDELGREYDYSEKPYYVLCRSGWVEPSYIYRHKTSKDIYEVTDGDMRVEVTEDHSLFNDNKEKIKPSEINDQTKLEYYKGEITCDHCVNNLDMDSVEKSAIYVARGDYDRVPVLVLNGNDDIKKRFYYTFMGNYSDNIKYTKTCVAGLQYLRKSFGK